ncbi:Uncharacterized protein (Fragment), partial [Durusdinium trenchii]
MARAQVSIKMEQETLERLDAIAGEFEMTRTAFIEKAVEEALEDKERWLAEVRKAGPVERAVQDLILARPEIFVAIAKLIGDELPADIKDSAGKMRRIKDKASRYYTAEHRFAGDHKPKRKALRVTRKDVAVKLGWEWVRQEEARRGGIAEADYRQAELPPLVNDYLVSLRRGQNRTVEHVRKSRQRLERIFNDLKWRQICDASPAGLRKWLEGYEGSAKTANHYRQAVVAFFNWLERDGLLDENPIARVRPLRGAAKRTEEKSVFSFGEVERLIAVDPARSLVYAMLFYTGLRQAELQRLR